ncbi:MAG: hypothetical protein Q9163_000755 [Psora crenata]
MSPLKRTTTTRTSDGTHRKKLKTGASKDVKTSTPSQRSNTAEVETDSDPIIESDTASQSGDDDGVSWPSDDGSDDDTGAGADLSEAEGEGNGGRAKITTKPKDTQNNPLGNASKESHAKQKAISQERKATKPNADSIARSKKLWERLRRKSHVPLEERTRLLTELFDIIAGRVKDFVFKHDAVRVIQTALKYANLDQRKTIAKELKGEYKVLAQSKYAKFLLGKILVRGDDEIRDFVVPEFYGHVRRLIKHPEASWILDDIYRGAATPLQKATLLREWYGAEFALFKPKSKEAPSVDLKELLAESPEKRKPIMRSLQELINLLIQKKTTGFTMLHDAMLQYFLNLQSGSEEATEFVELVKGDEEGDLLKNLAFTKSGAYLVCLILAYANAKDRKLILRAFRDTIRLMAYDTHAHQILLTAYDVIDDTVLLSKSIFPELVGKDQDSDSQQRELLSMANNFNARMPLLYLFSGKSRAILSERDMELMEEIHRIRASTSKKDPATRRKELISHLSPPLISLIASRAEDLISTSFGCQFVTEVLLNGSGDRHAAMVSIACLVKKNGDTGDILGTPAARRMLKTLSQGGRFNQARQRIDTVEPPLGFHDILYGELSEVLVDWATGPNSFVVVGLLEAPNFPRVEEMKERLKKCRARLEEAARGGDEVPKEKRKKRNVKGDGDKIGHLKGYPGTRILLEKLDK